MSHAANSTKSSPDPLIYQVKVTLQDIRPPIWRRLLLRSDTPLDEFHSIIQIAMGWEFSHLHEFLRGNRNDLERYGATDLDWDFKDVKDETRFKLRDLLREEKDKALYIYDFGDDWVHVLLLEKILPWDPKAELPRCIKGKRACPPEDVGGPYGYGDFLEVLADPEHPNHQEMVEWVAGPFDPEAFDMEAVNTALRTAFSPKPGKPTKPGRQKKSGLES